MINDFIYSSNKIQNIKGTCKWRSPSNIALIKYWGKKPNQIPLNTSLSITLKDCYTITKVFYQSRNKTGNNFEFFFEGKTKSSFEEKLNQFFNRIDKYCSFLSLLELKIESINSFPHSSGIASSASSYSALSLCIMEIEKKLNPEIDDKYFFQKASFLARLGSGSACRSIIGFFSTWGQTSLLNHSSDLYATRFSSKIHNIFNDLCDTVLIVDKREKEVSSTIGHQLMNGHMYNKDRLDQANSNLNKLKDALENGNYDLFIKIVELEALSLHAMMMTSEPYFILMKPNTLEIINLVWKYRKEKKSKVCFTLDAGANIHLIYPENEYTKVQSFIKKDLLKFCHLGEFINDKIGSGPFKL